MKSIRTEIRAAWRRSGMTRYELAKKLWGKVPQSSVYAYLAGTRDLGSEALGHMMKVLSLEIRPK